MFQLPFLLVDVLHGVLVRPTRALAEWYVLAKKRVHTEETLLALKRCETDIGQSWAACFSSHDISPSGLCFPKYHALMHVILSILLTGMLLWRDANCTERAHRIKVAIDLTSQSTSCIKVYSKPQFLVFIKTKTSLINYTQLTLINPTQIKDPIKGRINGRNVSQVIAKANSRATTLETIGHTHDSNVQVINKFVYVCCI